jgi:DNA invertase Pin-like site-specific DNA recombinase
MKKAVIYARVSSTIERNRQNTERQVSDLKAYAEFAKLEVVEVFEEYISGGKRNDERPILQDAIDYCIENKVDFLLTSELSRVGRSTFEVLETVKTLIDHKINLYMQKEQLTLLDDNGKPSMFAPIMLATLATCAQIERDNIQFHLSSGYKNFKANGGKVGRKKGSIKTNEQKKEEYKEIIQLLKKGYSVRNVAKIANRGISTVQRIKTDFCL